MSMTRYSQRTAICVLGAFSFLISIFSLAADQPTPEQFAAADKARVEYEQSGDAAASALVDDGFLSSEEFAEKRSEAREAGDPVKKAAWDSQVLAIMGKYWSVDFPDVSLNLGAWNSDKQLWRIDVACSNKWLSFKSQFEWSIASEPDPHSMYTDVSAQARAKTLTARILYALFWKGGSIWREFPVALKIFGRDSSGREIELGIVQINPVLLSFIVDATHADGATRASIVDMVDVAGGTFQMGDAENGPIHKVTVSDFRMASTEVTQALYFSVTGTNPSVFQNGGRYSEFDFSPNNPVDTVSWYDAVNFCNKLSALDGRSPAYTIKGTTVTIDPKASGYRLPTEAEWEYAARGGQQGLKDNFVYSGGNDPDEVAWYTFPSQLHTHPVAQKKPNQLGLYDLSGNVWEWCYDWYGDYPKSAKPNPIGSVSGVNRCIRGGAWNEGARAARIANRNYAEPDRHYYIGFRVVLPADR